MRAGWTGGVSVSAAAAGWTSPGWSGGAGGVPWAPAVGTSGCGPVAAPFVPPACADATDLDGGFQAWRAAGLPVQPGGD